MLFTFLIALIHLFENIASSTKFAYTSRKERENKRYDFYPDDVDMPEITKVYSSHLHCQY